MAQQFVGSNNINLLFPDGNFGTRRSGGKDSASERYIFTYLENITKYIYRNEDMPIYEYAIEEGSKVEPIVFAPIIPMILVNGTLGIGTGYSSFIPNFNPMDIIRNIECLMNSQQQYKLQPWYRNFTGVIEEIEDNKYITHGTYEILDQYTVKITELPVGVWMDDYNAFLKTLLCGQKDIKDTKDKKDTKPKKQLELLVDYINHSENETVEFILKFYGMELQNLIKSGKLETTLKLTSSLPMTNMHLYNASGVITNYDCVEDIISEFYDFRLSVYEKRKKYYLTLLVNELDILKYKLLFIEYYCKGTIKLDHVKKSDVIKRLIELKFPKLSTNINAIDSDGNDDNDNEEIEDDENNNTEKKVYKTYDYITSMKLFSLTEEKYNELKNQCEMKKIELENYKKTEPTQMWQNELNEFKNVYVKWLKDLEDTNKKFSKGKSTNVTTLKKKVATKKQPIKK